MEVPCVNGHSSVMGGSFHTGEKRGSETGVMTPLGPYQKVRAVADDSPSPALHFSPVQTFKHISHILAFDSLQGLICGVHWGGSMAVLDREVSFWTCSSVDWFGSLERIKAPFVLPKSTEGPPSLLLSERTWLGKQYTKYAFSLSCMIVHSLSLSFSWPLSPFKYHFFSFL